MNDIAKPSRKSLAKKFYQKFEAIPEEKWCVGTLSTATGQHCVIGHVGAIVTQEKYIPTTTEAEEFNSLIPLNDNKGAISAWEINDGHEGYPQPTPRLRILAALRDIIDGRA